MADKAKGMQLMDTEGNNYLDASGGAVVLNVGHGREEIARAVYDQICKCDYAHPTMFTNSPVEELAKALCKHAPPGIERFYFLSGGSEATETAIKLARQIHLANDRPHRTQLIARWKSYHGLTLGALSAMGRTAFREPYTPLLNQVEHIAPPYCLRCSFGLSYPSCDCRCAYALEETIQNLGPETVSAFMAETVSGGTLAAAPPPPTYFKIIREICDHYNVLLILDEVMCGLGRTGRWFASEHFNITPDMAILERVWVAVQSPCRLWVYKAGISRPSAREGGHLSMAALLPITARLRQQVWLCLEYWSEKNSLIVWPDSEKF